jgi:ABC-2 type transport system permease protein
MNPPSHVSELAVESQAVASPALPQTRPLYWLVRRELWENRSLYLAPLIVEGFVLFGFLISAMTLPRRIGAILALDPANQYEKLSMPFHAAAGLVVVIAFVVGFFYCLDALHSERRDRSILFWKSLPLSDRTTVLSKASIPLVVLPLFVYAIAVIAQVIMLLVSTLVLLGNARGLAALWSHVKFIQSPLALLYGLIAISLWHAPVYAWLLLVSAWARRATVLWVVLPLVAIAMFESIAFRSSHFAAWLGYRLIGWFQLAFTDPPKGSAAAMEPLAHLAPGTFLSTPGLWLGLIFAAGFLAAAIRLRRNREAI